jgi:CubicO group peptidase (beta-lactamase class C family)
VGKTARHGRRRSDRDEAVEGVTMRVLAVALAALLAGFAPLPKSIDATLRADTAKGFSGAVLIAHGNRVVFDRAYGTIKGVPVRTNSRFWIASSGKQFVSASILKCVERGWMSLDDPISRFFPNAPADKRTITVRQLLAHLSGLDQTYAAEGIADRDAAVTAMLSKPMADKPGVKFHYSNDNYELAAAIVEIASGEDYRTFVQKTFWQPLGMHDTGFNSMSGAKAVLPAHDDTPDRLKTQMRGEAGIYSTTHDLYRWWRSLHDGRVLTKASAAILFAPETPIGEGQAAFGWFLGKAAGGTAAVFTRGNEDFGPNSLIYSYPSRNTTIIVLTHAGDANDDASWSRFVLKQLEAVLSL